MHQQAGLPEGAGPKETAHRPPCMCSGRAYSQTHCQPVDRTICIVKDSYYLTYIDPSVHSLAATNWRELLGMVSTCIELEAVSVLQHLAFLLEADPAIFDIPGGKLWNQLRSTYSQVTPANYVTSIPHNSAFTASILCHTWHYYTTYFYQEHNVGM